MTTYSIPSPFAASTPRCQIDGLADDREVKPVAGADVAIKHAAVMLGGRLATGLW
jgi:hypothetical protein